MEPNINPDTKAENANHQADNSPKSQSPNVLEAKNNYSCDNKEKTPKISNEKTNVPESIMIWANIFLVIINAILAIATCLSVKYSNQMAKATEKTIAIAESSNIIQQQNMFASNTPYISISVIKEDMSIIKGKSITGVIHYLNTGKTPALDFRSLPIIKFEGEFAKYIADPPIRDDISVGKNILMPEDFINKDFHSHILSENDVLYINNGICKIFICSVVNYRDVFGHKFQVTQRLKWDGKSFIPDDKGNEYRQY